MTELALHEAGHAILFDALGIQIQFVTITEGCDGKEPSFEGCVALQRKSNPAGDVIIATLAGPGASFFIAGAVADQDSMARYKSDQRHLQQIHAEQANAGRQGEYWSCLMEFLHGPMRIWLLKNRDVILRFATMLSAARTLSGEALRKALNSAWMGRKPDMEHLRQELQAILNSGNTSSPAT